MWVRPGINPHAAHGRREFQALQCALTGHETACESRVKPLSLPPPPTYTPTLLPPPSCLPAFLPSCLPASLPPCLPTYQPTNLPTYQPTYPPPSSSSSSSSPLPRVHCRACGAMKKAGKRGRRNRSEPSGAPPAQTDDQEAPGTNGTQDRIKSLELARKTLADAGQPGPAEVTQQQIALKDR